MAVCASCGAENDEGVKFCGECGSPLALVCPACSAPNAAGRKFCGECGAPLTSANPPPTSTLAPDPAPPPLAERRLVSVLFADLVGFTPLSESRDPEEVRELLSRYFESCRRLVELYGGTVEKFIGGAVVAVWAVRVTAARGGALRSEGLEAPFVGRERELRLVKELFHAAAEQSRAQLVQISGIAGIGKSRLAWEFFKYLDGLAENIFWHRGRCLAYGEGVAYWALAEMVRTRAQILEGEPQERARVKLQACLAEHLPDEEERAWVGPRLGNLLGLEERSDTDRQDLFAAWRLFFERLAETSPVVLVFEDLQWADPALLAFVEYLLEWSEAQRLYVLALSRPELAERQPEFGRGVRNAASLALKPLADPEMTALLDGYVPGLPEELRAQVLARAQGVPLYAVETVRMLLDRGLLAQEGSVYRPTGETETLEVPETLQALIAARLDGLPAEERT